MRKLIVAMFILICGAVTIAQQNTKRVFLSPKSNVTTAQVAEGFAKYCPNVVVTQNEEKADYVLEAGETTYMDEGTSYPRWHLTLFNRDGDVLVTTHPEMHFSHKFKHHFETVCKYINK